MMAFRRTAAVRQIGSESKPSVNQVTCIAAQVSEQPPLMKIATNQAAISHPASGRFPESKIRFRKRLSSRLLKTTLDM